MSYMLNETQLFYLQLQIVNLNILCIDLHYFFSLQKFIYFSFLLVYVSKTLLHNNPKHNEH